jgi:hypothetical protein
VTEVSLHFLNQQKITGYFVKMGQDISKMIYEHVLDIQGQSKLHDAQSKKNH